MKIVHVGHAKGGSGVFMKNLSKELLKCGYNSSIVTYGENIGNTVTYQPDIVVSYILDEEILDKSFYTTLREKLAECSLVIFHSFSNLTSIKIADYIKNNLHKEIISIIHSPSFSSNQKGLTPRNIYYYLRKIILTRNIVKLSKKIIFVGNAQMKGYMKYLLNKKEFLKKSTYINNFIEDSYFSYKRECNQKKLSFLFCGRLTKVKGVQDIIEYKKNYYTPNYTFNFAGNGELREKLININDKSIILHGNINGTKLIDMYDKNEFYLFPTYSEACSLSLIEAMSRGMVIICSDIEPNKDIITDGENGVLFKKGDIKSMNNAIESIINDETKKNIIKKNNIEKSKRFHPDVVIQKYINIIEEFKKNI